MILSSRWRYLINIKRTLMKIIKSGNPKCEVSKLLLMELVTVIPDFLDLETKILPL